MDPEKILLWLHFLVGQQKMGRSVDMNVERNIYKYCHSCQHFKGTVVLLTVIELMGSSGGELKPQVCIPRAGVILAISQGRFCVLTGQWQAVMPKNFMKHLCFWFMRFSIHLMIFNSLRHLLQYVGLGQKFCGSLYIKLLFLVKCVTLCPQFCL